MQRFLLIIAMFWCVILVGQNVTVLDYDTKFPIQHCLVHGEDSTNVMHTDKYGIADLTKFEKNEVISFQHMYFVEVETLKRQLFENDSILFLHKKTESLEEVILSSSRQKESRSRIAEHVEVSTIDEIYDLAPQTSADLLAATPGVKVQKSQFGGGSPVLRGLEANRVLLVVDGVRMNNAIYRAGHLQSSITVSPSVLERMEVVFGPSSVIYGSDALGGVIHYYTKTPKISNKKEVDVDLISRYSSVNDEVSNQGSVSLSFKKWASLTSFSYTEFGDLKMGNKRSHGFEDWGKVNEFSDNTDTYYNSNPVINSDPNIQKNTGYIQKDFLQKFYFQLSEDSNLTLNFQHSESSDIPRFDKLTEKSDGKLKFSEWNYGPQERMMLSTQLDIQPNKEWMETGVFTVAYQKLGESRIQRKFNSLERLYRIEGVDVFSFNGDFSVPLAEKSRGKLSYGIEFAHNNVDSDSYGKTLDIVGNDVVGFSEDFRVQSRYPDGGSTYTNAAIYTSYRQDVSEKGTLNTGIRYTSTWLHAKWIDETFIQLPDNDINLKNGAFTATMGYAYRPSKSWQLNSIVSSGFRSPNIDDIGKIREKKGKVTVPNIDLRPEFAYNMEFGALRYLNERKFKIGVNIYYTLLNNYISREPFLLNGSPTITYDGEEAETYANMNHDNAYILGSTFSINGYLSKFLSTSGSFTFTKGKAYDTDLALSSIPPFYGNLELKFAKRRFETALNYRFNGKKDYEDYNLVEGIDNIEQSPYNDATGSYIGTPKWSTLNFYSKYSLNYSIDIQFKIDNVFDEHYKEFASGISSPGRSYIISLIVH